MIVAISKGVEFEIKNSYPSFEKKIKTIYNGFKLELPVTSKAINEEYFILTWAGRFGDEKGLDELITVFTSCYRADQSIRLLLLGDGYYREKILKQLQDNEIKAIVSDKFSIDLFEDNAVVCCNPGTEFENYLARGDLFILTSPSEGLGNVIIEALQQRLPVVSTDCKWGPREVLEPSLHCLASISYPHFGEYGILLPLFNNEDAYKIWETTILRLRSEKSLLVNYRQKSDKACKRFDQDVIKKQWFEIIDEVIK